MTLLHRTFTAHLGGEWPEEFTVDVIGRERSAFAMRKSEPAKPLRRWLGTARKVTDDRGVEHLTSTRPRPPQPLAKRLSYAAARGDELADSKLPAKQLRALLRPVLAAVSVLTAKAEREAMGAARRKRKAAKRAGSVVKAADAVAP